MDAGEVSVSAAATIAKQPKDEQRRIVAEENLTKAVSKLRRFAMRKRWDKFAGSEMRPNVRNCEIRDGSDSVRQLRCCILFVRQITQLVGENDRFINAPEFSRTACTPTIFV